MTFIAIFSVWRGINSGVKLLSNINMLMAFALLATIAMIGFPISTSSIWTAINSYAQSILPLSNTLGREDTEWFHNWTVFYWALGIRGHHLSVCLSPEYRKVEVFVNLLLQ